MFQYLNLSLIFETIEILKYHISHTITLSGIGDIHGKENGRLGKRFGKGRRHRIGRRFGRLLNSCSQKGSKINKMKILGVRTMPKKKKAEVVTE